MILHHFTHLEGRDSIERDGIIRTTESNIGSGRKDWPPSGPDVGPPVVWLTTNGRADTNRTGLSDGSYIEIPPGMKIRRHDGNIEISTGMKVRTADKSAVRFTVDVPDVEAFRFIDWAPRQGINPRWFSAMTSSYDADEWYVTIRPIPRSEWLEVVDLSAFRGVGRNEPCPCGSGAKFKRCHALI